MPGTPILFKLHKPQGDRIVGFGLFSRHDVVPTWLAWEAFEGGNGAPNLAVMRSQIEDYRRKSGTPGASRAGDYLIGCTILAQPIFLDRAAWVRPPDDWPLSVQVGKSYDLDQGEGARVWQDVLASASSVRGGASLSGPLSDPTGRYGEPTLVRPRLGQGSFRFAVTAAYASACAVTHEHSLPALEAAHIRPFAEEGSHDVSNGLLLRSDIHRLFDKGYVSITAKHEFVVSRRLKDDFDNGHSYYPLNGRTIQLPQNVAEYPDQRQLEWHVGERFLG